MKTVHALSIALMLGFAAVLGAVVATQAVNASHAAAARPASVTTSPRAGLQVSTAGSISYSARCSAALRSCRRSCTSPRSATPRRLAAPALRLERQRSGAAHDLRPRQGAARHDRTSTSTSTSESGSGEGGHDD